MEVLLLLLFHALWCPGVFSSHTRQSLHQSSL